MQIKMPIGFFFKLIRVYYCYSIISTDTGHMESYDEWEGVGRRELGLYVVYIEGGAYQRLNTFVLCFKGR